jgi:membrane protease YdiL (CAAX protease family)
VSASLRLARLLVRLRFRLLWNALRWRRGRVPGLVLFMGLFTAVAYVGLFSQAFGAIVAATDAAGQVAALSLIVTTVVLGTLAAKASGNEAMLAGSPENEFLLARPVSLPALLVARSLAEAVTDPFGALFLFPVLVAAALTWDLGAAAWLAAALTSMIVQVAISAAAQAVQIAVVRYTRPQRRRLVWVALRLVASLALAALWMTGTWVLRAPRALAAAVAAREALIAWSPGAAITRPLVALLRDDPAAVGLALASLLAAAALVLAAAYALARRAGMHGWEEAGAPWAEVAAGPAARPVDGVGAGFGARPLTAATKDLRLILRDRSQLLKLIAMPVIFVGIQLFGAAGWSWSTASLRRVAFLSYSLCLYMATIGPLGHMQAERRAFWILRTVPVSVGRLMAAKARTWSLVLGGIAAVTFLSFSVGVAGATLGERLTLALLVVAGAVGMAWLAVALACQTADLSDEQRPAIGPATVYLFLLVGGLYNLVLGGDGPLRARGLILYGFAVFALWSSGMEQAARCLDPDERHRRQVRLGDAATLVVLGDLGRRAAMAGVRLVGEQGALARLLARDGVTALVGVAAGFYLARRARAAPRMKALPSAALALLLGGAAAALVAWLGLAPRLLSTATDTATATSSSPSAVAWSGALGLILCEELILRGILQRALEENWAGRRAARLGAALLAAVIGVVASSAPVLLALAPQLIASLARAQTGRTWPSWTARAALVAGVALSIG